MSDEPPAYGPRRARRADPDGDGTPTPAGDHDDETSAPADDQVEADGAAADAPTAAAGTTVDAGSDDAGSDDAGSDDARAAADGTDDEDAPPPLYRDDPARDLDVDLAPPRAPQRGASVAGGTDTPR